MSSYPSGIGDFLHREEGATAVEYAIMLAVIIVGAIAAVLTSGNSMREAWQAIEADTQQALSQ